MVLALRGSAFFPVFDTISFFRSTGDLVAISSARSLCDGSLIIDGLMPA